MSSSTAFTVSLAAILLFALSANTSAGEQLHVAVNGDDRNPGTKAAPFATLESARDAVRAARKTCAPKGGFTVWVHGGTYELAAPLALAAEDSGTKDAPITYRAWPSDTVILTGGRAITDWKPVKDPKTLSRIDDSAKSHILQADVKKLGISDFGSPVGIGSMPELFFNNERMKLARWPNEGFANVVDVTYVKPIESHGLRGDAVGKFIYEDNRPERWTAEKDAYLHGYWFWDWSDSYERVASIDTAAKTITLTEPYHHYGYRKGMRYYAVNLLSELDSPGEWYLDRDTGTVYFWPPKPIENQKVVLSTTPSLITMNDVHHVSFMGMILEGTRGTAVSITGGSNTKIAGCVVRNVGSYGVQVNGGTNNGVIGCDIYQTGEGGISLSGGDRKTLTPAGNYAENNVIHRFAEIGRTYRPAVLVSGVGQVVRHNHMYDAPHNAVLQSGNDHLLEFNDIHNVCHETGDVGAFYMGRNWTDRGNVVRYNYFHDIDAPGFIGAMAVYLDDTECGVTIYGNLFYKAARAAFIGGGRDNIVENNIFVDCDPSVFVDARGTSWMKDLVDEGGYLREKLAEMPYKTPPWSDRYPALVNILEDEPGMPKGNVVRRNVSWKGKWTFLEDTAKPLVKFEDNLVDVDPHFVDAEKLDFQIEDDSPAYKLGFQRIPIERIGVYEDRYRALLPKD